jgi:hypothetical protein
MLVMLPDISFPCSGRYPSNQYNHSSPTYTQSCSPRLDTVQTQLHAARPRYSTPTVPRLLIACRTRVAPKKQQQCEGGWHACATTMGCNNPVCSLPTAVRYAAIGVSEVGMRQAQHRPTATFVSHSVFPDRDAHSHTKDDTNNK